MAREELTIYKITSRGLIEGSDNDFEYTTISDADGAKFDNRGRQFLHVKAGEAETILTIPTPVTFNGDLQLDDRIITLAINEEMFIGPFERNLYNQTDGTVHVDSDQADTEVVALTF